MGQCLIRDSISWNANGAALSAEMRIMRLWAEQELGSSLQGGLTGSAHHRQSCCCCCWFCALAANLFYTFCSRREREEGNVEKQ